MPPSRTPERNFTLGISPYTYADLYVPERLRALADTFYAELESVAPQLARSFASYRGGAELDAQHESALLVDVAGHLGPFVARLFQVEPALRNHRERTASQDVIFTFKREFVGKRVRKRVKDVTGEAVDDAAYRALEAKLGG